MADIMIRDGQDSIKIVYATPGIDATFMREDSEQYRYVGYTSYAAAVEKAIAVRAAGHEAQVRRSHACGFFEVSVTELTRYAWEPVEEEE